MCGDTGVLVGLVGASCGMRCGRLSCDGPNLLRCESLMNACGGCAAFPRAPGKACECGNGAKG
jgi:hypothetical protein